MTDRPTSVVPVHKKMWEHGNISTYDYRKCRCEKCKAVNSERKREYRKKKRLDKESSLL